MSKGKKIPCDHADAGCTNMATTLMTVCKNCRSAELRWSKKKPSEVLKRRTQLNLYGSRIAPMVESAEEDNKNVVPFRRRKAEGNVVPIRRRNAA